MCFSNPLNLIAIGKVAASLMGKIERRVHQICIATDRNIEDVVQQWITVLGVSPWKIITVTNDLVRDPRMNNVPIVEPFMYYCAIAQYGGIEIEICKPEYGPSMLTEFLENKGEGVQHIKEYVSDSEFQKYIAHLEIMGAKRTFSGFIGEDSFCNFNTSHLLGFNLEIGNCAPEVIIPEHAIYWLRGPKY